ncbi:hypothetical protein NKJ26_09600 [Mesorhizobium sp. M0152]|uniref:hypothetical protein n=1 Tax=Mesorhizobium sp. M0152 TaxID=2956898 RepID=UPI00333B329C
MGVDLARASKAIQTAPRPSSDQAPAPAIDSARKAARYGNVLHQHLLVLAVEGGPSVSVK